MEGRRGFVTLLKCTARLLGFLRLTALSLFNLRINDRIPRPFAVPLFPVVRSVLATCCYMLYSSIQYARQFGLVGASILLLGLPLFALCAAAVSPGRLAAESSPENLSACQRYPNVFRNCHHFI